MNTHLKMKDRIVKQGVDTSGRGERMEGKGEIWSMNFMYLYENRTIKPEGEKKISRIQHGQENKDHVQS
jgi:hypothetical protein